MESHAVLVSQAEVRFWVANMSSPRIVGWHVGSILRWPRTLHAQKSDAGSSFESDSDRCHEKVTDHEYQNAFYHSVSHR
jgi:hypothetical protein